MRVSLISVALGALVPQCGGLHIGGAVAPAPVALRHACAPPVMLADEAPRVGALRRIATAAALTLGGMLGPSAIARQLPGAQAVAQEVSQLAPQQSKRARKLVQQKLAKVPIFMVTNEAGSPYLNPMSNGDQAALMFLAPEEAQRMLAGTQRSPNGGGARITVTNLDRAFRLAQLAPQTSGLTDQVSGRELKMEWKFMPHAAEVRAAQGLLVTKGKAPGVPRIPAYIAPGLVYKKGGRDVRPLFMSRKDVQDALTKSGAGGKREIQARAPRRAGIDTTRTAC